MRLVAWIVLAWLMMVILSALTSRMSLAHLCPNAALVVLLFLAMRKSIPTLMAASLAVGHIEGVLCLAPPGLHEGALTAVVLGAIFISGKLTASGGRSFFFMCLLGDCVFNVLLALLLLAQGYAVGFSSWATASLLPQSFVTACMGLMAYRPLLRLDALLAPRKLGGLQWH